MTAVVPNNGIALAVSDRLPTDSHPVVPFVLSEVDAQATGGIFGFMSFDFAQDERKTVFSSLGQYLSS